MSTQFIAGGPVRGYSGWVGPRFFTCAGDFREWLTAHHQSEEELLVGFWKVGSGKTSMTWPESVDEALCFGWIDGVRRRIDDGSYSIRFTPRRAKSVWSAVNIAKVEELERRGLMTAAGRAAFEKRVAGRSGIYAYENRERLLDPEYEKRFRKNGPAWSYFETQPAWYRRQMIYWVVGAKQERTRLRRLEKLIAGCQEGRRL